MVAEVNVRSVSDYAPEDAALLCAVGRLVCAWTMLEQSLEAKIAMMREAMGDVRTVGARTRPGMTKLMTELRTMVSMRDRRNASALMEISDIERDMQRIDRFRSLIIGGFQQPAPGGFTCRDARNNQTHVSLEQLEAEIASLERVAQRLLASLNADPTASGSESLKAARSGRPSSEITYDSFAPAVLSARSPSCSDVAAETDGGRKSNASILLSASR